MKLPPLVIFVTGDRNWEGSLRKHLKGHPTGTWVVQGGCAGADEQAELDGKSLGYQPIRMDAIWDFHHKAAGPIRNTEMGKLLNIFQLAGIPIKALVVHDDLEHSKGTKHMTTVLDKLGIEWKRVQHE